MDIQGKTVLLTGASGGIGQALARALAAAGARLILSGRKHEQLNVIRQELPGEGHLVIAVDLSDERDRQKLITMAKAQNVDVLINNAGINQLSMHADMSPAEVAGMIDINLTVPMILCSQLIPILQRRQAAMIINVGSIMGSIGMAGSATYCASKFGLRGFTESLRRELADSPVRVVYFAPRMTSTAINDDKMVAMNSALGTAMDQPAEVAQQLMSVIASHSRREHYIGWPEKLFVRINSLLPGVVDRALRKQLPTVLSHATHH